jgi:hypothetical protein
MQKVQAVEGPTWVNCVILTSVLSPEADIVTADRHVSKVPGTEVGAAIRSARRQRSADLAARLSRAALPS